MKANFGIALAHALKHEGGFVSHPKDPGCRNLKKIIDMMGEK